MSVDTISNFLTVLRNAISISKRSVTTHYSRMREDIVKILKEEGFIRDYKVIADDEKKKQLKVDLKYVDGECAIHALDRVSRPGRRNYTKLKNLKPVIGGLGISILSTNAGVITDKKANELSVGGEVICQIW